jgi:hypothetical protein
MKNLYKRYTGEFLLILGVGIFVYNVFNFQSVGYGETNVASNDIDFNNPTYPNFQCFKYFYTTATQNQIVVGAILVTIGILIIRNKKGI